MSEDQGVLVELAITGVASADPDNIVGVHDSDIGAYYFELDEEDFDVDDNTLQDQLGGGQE